MKVQKPNSIPFYNAKQKYHPSKPFTVADSIKKALQHPKEINWSAATFC
jgi:hypothetical protein